MSRRRAKLCGSAALCLALTGWLACSDEDGGSDGGGGGADSTASDGDQGDSATEDNGVGDGPSDDGRADGVGDESEDDSGVGEDAEDESDGVGEDTDDSGGGDEDLTADGGGDAADDTPGDGGDAGDGDEGDAGDDCQASDPAELSALADADPSLDIRCVTTGVNNGGQPWIRVAFAGPWLPSNDFYSWYSTVSLLDPSPASLGTYTRQRHAGEDGTFLVAPLTAEDVVSFSVEASGYLLVLDASLAEELTFLLVLSGIQEESGSALRQDQTNATIPFDHTVRDP